MRYKRYAAHAEMAVTVWYFIGKLNDLKQEVRRLLLRVPNPSPYGPPLCFANQAQDRHQPGWLARGEFTS